MKSENICTSNCYGCAACSAICPVNAIIMQEDDKGFNVPIIDQNKCIDCNACKSICEKKIDLNIPKKVLIAKHRNKKVYLSSQSGGAFTAISDLILSQNGVVYGASLNDDLELIHIRSTTIKERDKMRGSKYLQSHVEYIYEQLLKDLREERKILFIGTPCQVSGVLKFVKEKKSDLSNLYTIDILCHGVPSSLLWRDLKKYYEKKYRCEIHQMILKETSKSKRLTHCYVMENKIISDELYRKLYYSNLALRMSCYQCKYSSMNRIGDFTIGDAWGTKKNNQEFFDDRGVSLLMFNTEKALQFEQLIKNNMYYKEVILQDYMQQCMVRPASAKRNPNSFWNDYKTKSFAYIIQKYAKHNILLNVNYMFFRLKKMMFKEKGWREK